MFKLKQYKKYKHYIIGIFINMLSSILTGCVNNLEIITNSEILTATNLGMISVTQPVHIILKNNTEEFIKIKYDNVEQNLINYFVDTQGYDYARYCGCIEGEF